METEVGWPGKKWTPSHLGEGVLEDSLQLRSLHRAIWPRDKGQGPLPFPEQATPPPHKTHAVPLPRLASV